MRDLWTGVAIALCAILLCTGNVSADGESLRSDALKKEADVMTPQILENMGVEVKEKEAMISKDDVLMEVNAGEHANDSSIKDRETLEKTESKKGQSEIMEEMEKVPENQTDDDAQILEEAKILAQPGMRRLARYLRNFHGRQIFNANAEAIYAQRHAAVSDDDEDAIAEERAVRRRKRIRRRNTKNKVKRRHHNKHVANHNKTSRRKLNNRSSLRRKNTNRSTSKRNQKRNNSNVRRGYTRDPTRHRSGPRRVSANDRRTSRKGVRKSSKPLKQKKKNKKNKKQKQRNKKNKNRKQKKPYRPDSNSGREDDNQNAPAEAHEEQYAAESPAA